MEYSYHGESLLFYLRKHVVATDKEAMKLARNIVFYAMEHPENSFETSVDQYMKLFLSQTEENKKTKYKVLPAYLNVNQLSYHQMSLDVFLEKYCSKDFYDSKELTSCRRSIQHYLYKNEVKKTEVEFGIQAYFETEYPKFLKTYFMNHYTYHGKTLDSMIKYYLPETHYGKDQVYLYKKKWLHYIEQNYDKKEQHLNFSLDRLFEYYIRQVFNKDVRQDLTNMNSLYTIKNQDRKR